MLLWVLRALLEAPLEWVKRLKTLEMMRHPHLMKTSLEKQSKSHKNEHFFTLKLIVIFFSLSELNTGLHIRSAFESMLLHLFLYDYNLERVLIVAWIFLCDSLWIFMNSRLALRKVAWFPQKEVPQNFRQTYLTGKWSNSADINSENVLRKVYFLDLKYHE